MRYFVTVGGSEVGVDVEPNGEHFVVRDGHGQRVAQVNRDGGSYRVLLGERVLSLDVRPGASDSGQAPKLEVQVLGVKISAQVIAERDRVAEPGASEQNSVQRPIAAPMPGKVLHLRVKPGDRVQSGQALLVMEAMKMENELCAEQDLHILEVHVKVGDTVEAAARLLLVE
jgi:biotin carboxyl carrier protein